MVEQQLSPMGFLYTGAFLFFLWLYWRWGNKVIRYRKAKIQQRFDELENGLANELVDYTCFTNNHPYVWGEIDYSAEKASMIEECKWTYAGTTPVPGGDLKFSLKADDSLKALYIAHHSENFDWNSLHHYEEWLESMREVGENIERYKREERERRDTENRIIA